MPYKLTVDQPNIGDQEIYIHGLGMFGNGTHDISDEQASEFRHINATRGLSEVDPEGNYHIITALGPDLEDAVSRMYGVTVEATAASDDASNKSTKVAQPVESGGTPDKTVTPRDITQGGEQ